jgi:octaprenyl-diphosphate synthase
LHALGVKALTAGMFERLKSGPVGEIVGELALAVAQVEQELERQMGSRVELAERAGLLTLQGGGKRLRPALTILAAKTCGHVEPGRLVRLGACMEMIHMATLLHDDVIDGAATRRGRPTAANLFGGTAGVLCGDVLLSKAMRLLAEDGDLAIIRLVSQAVVEMAEGEVAELETRGRFDLSEEEHLEILRMKTAAFIEACCRVGALAANAPAALQDALGTYGHALGMAFQVVDDLLDFSGDKAKTGKPRATDFREGCATLPLIYLREQLSESELQVAMSAFGNGVSDADLDNLVAWIDSRGASARARSVAEDFAQRAATALEALPDSGERDLLRSVAEFVTAREA